MSDGQKHIVILGNGISGVTCARYIRKNDSKASITVVSGESLYFFSRTALMYIYMGHMKWEHTKPYEDWFWDKNRISLVKEWVYRVEFGTKELVFQDGRRMGYDVLVLATGSKPAVYGWQGEDLDGVQGLYSLQDLALLEENTRNTKQAVIVGGGLIGVELAEMLRSRKIPVTMLVRESHFWGDVLPPEEGSMVGNHIREHGVDLRLSTSLEAVLPGIDGRVSAVKTTAGEEISCDFVGLTVGVVPNIGFLKKDSNEGSTLEINKGILVNDCFETSIPDVYAVGDCAEFKKPVGPDRRRIEQVWYTGRMHGEVLGRNLGRSERNPYKPGPWFNSAKFFDLEYQVYGSVPSGPFEEVDSFYWQHEKEPVAMRFVYRSDSRILMGIHAIGWRLDHVFFDQAITNAWRVEQVLESLEEASFNAEFYRISCGSVRRAFISQTGIQVKRSRKSWLQWVFGK
ncbi:Nitrite reductase probable [NAD(P)H] subunit [Lunatimonas lonarensis]|uniref:Nitrite reductase probable [NAD(P)H] subunit n=1 Tax=Lunatimonas lonarensis TaxID=1232681 RepID=R7ZUB4_9BACT|nr:FAD/NAD(P)-binding oxidoreductase [Lunatimonas lonarensis]EON77657.1 Nitrite reductase probable [NAD(P)H] subunit [Lunatimonas lonarensis]